MPGFKRLEVIREWHRFENVGDVCQGIIRKIEPHQPSQYYTQQTVVTLMLPDGNTTKVAVNEKPAYRNVIEELASGSAMGKEFRVTLVEKKKDSKYYTYEISE